MAKTEVYSWRVSAETKRALEFEARRESLGLAALLDRIAQDWLEARRTSAGSGEAEQSRLHTGAAKCIGSIAGSDPDRTRNARLEIRRRLRERRGR